MVDAVNASPPSRPSTAGRRPPSAVDLAVDAADGPAGGSFIGQPVAPKFLDRPDLGTSVQLMSASFRGSASTALGSGGGGACGSRQSAEASANGRRSGVEDYPQRPPSATQSRRPSTATALEVTENGHAPAAGHWGLPEAPRHGDRPDLECSMTLGSAAFRGSAPTNPEPRERSRPSSSCGGSPGADSAGSGVAVAAAIRAAGDSQSEVSASSSPPLRRSRPSSATQLRRPPTATNLETEGGASASGGGASFCGQPIAPRHGDRPDLSSSMQMNAASFRGSAASPLQPTNAVTPSGLRRPSGGMMSSSPCSPDVLPTYAALHGGSFAAQQQRPPSRSGGVAPLGGGGFALAGEFPTYAELHANDDDADASPTLQTPTNADRKIMMARSSRSVRGNVMAARAGPI